jgi:hypothetical protein
VPSRTTPDFHQILPEGVEKRPPSFIDKDTFEQRKTALLVERRKIEDSLTEWQGGKRREADKLQQILEWADSAYSAYNSGTELENAI